MPLKLNVGASRKVSDNNYGSRGASVHFELELDTALVKEPVKLQEKIRYLFGLVRTSLAEELNGHADAAAKTPSTNGHAAPSTNGHAGPSANGQNRFNGRSDSTPRRATASQCKAIHAIARAHDVNLGDFLDDKFKVHRPDELTIKQASQAIDDLKATSVGAGS